MKTTFKFIIAAMAAISVFSSCQKEPAKEKVNDTIDGVRTIAVQFDNSTKATLDGFTPKFANGDAIRVSNTEKSEECTVSVDGSGKATFSTKLSGDLTAIYPADAAVFTGNGPISDPFFKVLAIQDGDVAKAIIAKATIETGSSTAIFTGQTALFQITPPAGATTFTITSLRQIGTDGQRSSTAVAINTEGADDAAKRIITVTVPAGGTAYVSIVPDVKLSDLSFEYITDVTNGLGAMKGIPAKDIAAAGKTDATAANTKYTIGNTNWHPYVTIDGKKWATMNIGATSAIEVGKYFMWGEITGLTSNDISSANFPSSKYYSADNSSWVQTKGFAWYNCPWTCGKCDTRGVKKSSPSISPKPKRVLIGVEQVLPTIKPLLTLPTIPPMPIGAVPGVCRPMKNLIILRCYKGATLLKEVTSVILTHSKSSFPLLAMEIVRHSSPKTNTAAIGLLPWRVPPIMLWAFASVTMMTIPIRMLILTPTIVISASPFAPFQINKSKLSQAKRAQES